MTLLTSNLPKATWRADHSAAKRGNESGGKARFAGCRQGMEEGKRNGMQSSSAGTGQGELLKSARVGTQEHNAMNVRGGRVTVPVINPNKSHYCVQVQTVTPPLLLTWLRFERTKSQPCHIQTSV